MGSPGKFYVGKAVSEMQTSPYWGKITKVILHVNESEAYESDPIPGSGSGLTLEADCPWATQQIANVVLASVQGMEYRPYEAQKAIIDPSAELGDAVTADGIYSGIYTMSRTMSHLAALNIASPCDTETAHEYQYVSQENRQFIRRMKEINAEFGIMAGEISAKVSQVGGDNQSFGWVMNETGMYWYSQGTEVMRATSDGLKIIGTLESGSVVTGTLTVDGRQITANELYTGASQAASNWSNWSTGSGFGFDFNRATKTSSVYPNYFQTNNTIVTNHFSGNSIQVRTLTIEHNYTFKQVYVKSDGTLAVQV